DRPIPLSFVPSDAGHRDGPSWPEDALPELRSAAPGAGIARQDGAGRDAAPRSASPGFRCRALLLAGPGRGRVTVQPPRTGAIPAAPARCTTGGEVLAGAATA